MSPSLPACLPGFPGQGARRVWTKAIGKLPRFSKCRDWAGGGPEGGTELGDWGLGLWLPDGFGGSPIGSMSFSLPQKILPGSEQTEPPLGMASSICLKITRRLGSPSLGMRLGGRWLRENHLATDHSMLSPGRWGILVQPWAPGRQHPPTLVTTVCGGALGWEQKPRGLVPAALMPSLQPGSLLPDVDL